jgi:hypothetical protein
MTTFERSQCILGSLYKRPAIKVSQLAQPLGVSEGTIRDDLTAARMQGGHDGLESVLGSVPRRSIPELDSPCLMDEAQVMLRGRIPYAAWGVSTPAASCAHILVTKEIEGRSEPPLNRAWHI